MWLLDPSTIEWWLPAGYLLLAALVEVLWKARADRSLASGKRQVGEDDAPESIGSLRAPLLRESSARGETSEGFQQPKTHSITATGMLWATLTFSWGLCIYQGARAIVEAARHGFNTSIFLSSTVLCLAWALAAVLRSRDHWRQAAMPPKIDSNGLPANRRMWWVLWPFFNLAFITATVAVVDEANTGKTWSGLVNIAADDRLWNVIALVCNLVFVSCSVLSGAGVTLCTAKPNAEFTAGFLSSAMFSWFSPIIDVGQTKQLDLDDLPVQIDDDLSNVVWAKMDEADPRSPLSSLPCGKKKAAARSSGSSGSGGRGGYTRVEQEQADADAAAAEEAAASEKYVLLWRMWRVTKPLVISQGLWQLVATLTEFVPSLAMQQIIDFVSAYKKGEGGVTGRIALFVVLLFVGPLLQGVADGRNFHIGRRIGCRVRGALVGSVFRKMLKMDTSASTYSSGELTNLMSVDAQSVLEYSCYTHFIWATSLQVIVSVGLLFYVLGISAIGGVIFMVLSVPVGKWTTKKTQAFQKILMKRKDDRMSVVGETMQGIRIIKLFAWEKDFVSKIDKSRANEMRSLRGYMMMMVGVVTQWNSVTTLVGLCTFLVHTRLLGRTLTASQGFTSLSLFGILRFPLLVLPDVVNFYLQARVSLTRIEVFLGRGNVVGQPMGADAAGNGDGNGDGNGGPRAPVGGLLVQNGTFAWPVTDHSQSGDDLDEDGGQEEQKSNQTDALLSKDSAGSATPRSASPLPPTVPTLREVTLEVNPGELVCVYGPTGCGKSSLLMSLLGEVQRVEGTVEINGSVAYAAQRAWIQNATLRDNVLFGSPMDPERYARVLSACALTSDLDLLEAGDQTEIGEKGINLSGGQQQRVSLARAVYAQADVYLLDDVLSAVDAHVGEHIFKHCIRGILRDKAVIMVTHQVPMTARYADRVALMSPDGRMAEMGDPRQLMEDEGSRLWALINKVGGGARLKRQRSEESGSFKAEAAGSKPAMDREKNELVKEEGRQHGSPGIGIYVAYVRAAGGICLFLVPYLACHLIFNGLQFGQNLLLSRWVDKLEADANDGPAMWQYVAISFAVIVAVVCRALFESLASLKASTTMHDAMTARVMRAPVGWFEKTPLGRILNRFSSDIQELDKDVMDGLGSTLVCGFSAASIVIVISYTVPFLVVALLPISAIAFVMGTRYLNASRELKRLDSVSKSPIYAHFSESVNGVSTIRAFGAQDRFVKESCRRVDACNRAHFYLWVSNRWFNVRIQLVGATVAVLAGAFVVWWGKDHIEATVAGLALLYALQFTDAIKYLVRQHALLEMQMNSVERILEYTRDVPQEAAAVVQGRRPAPTWPEAGALSVKNLTVQYPNTDAPVIRGMTFEVAPRTRVGIVGRTGAGKSSLTAALFRLVEPSPGSVVSIDGVDALSLGLEDLRSRLAIVPQDPICFRGTVRSNLDPFMEYSDAAMWEALRQAHLDTSIRNGGGLDAPVDENGGNLSVGERQLMCMARALLRKSAVLVMDEATANVDPETDLLIQSTMREEFRNCTVLCIAHRLHTIIYYDRVMVLELGKLMEYASPLELLNDPNSLFYALCKKTGALEQLTETARGEQNEKLAREGDGGGSDEVGLSLSGGEEDAAGGVVGGAKGKS